MYEAKGAMKAQVLVDFVIKLTIGEINALSDFKWALYMDSLSNRKRSGAK